MGVDILAMEGKFKILEEVATADIAFEAYGDTIEEVFANSALCLFDIITHLEKIERKIEKEIEIESENKKALLFDFLSEFLYIFDTQHLVFSEIKLNISKKGENYLLKGKCKGEKFNPDKHKIKAEVKAVSYFDMKIEEKDAKWLTRVILDL